MTRRPICTSIACALFILAGPAYLMAPVNYPKIPDSCIAAPWDLMGLPEPALMARMILVESGGDPCAVSNRGAVGLCQITPWLARSLGADPGRLTEPDYNITLGARWLGRLIDRYGVDGALRAYLCGESNKALWYSQQANEYVRRIRG